MNKAAVITVSDSACAGTREDTGGPLVCSLLREAGFEIGRTAVVPDEQSQIEEILKECTDRDAFPLIVTTGGTGFSPRDVTPEATIAVCRRMTPGIPEAMRAASMQITPHAMLSRMVAGIRGASLIINLPGSPKAIRENLAVILPALGHGLATLGGTVRECARED